MDRTAELREMLLQYRLHELDEVRREQIDALLIGDADFSAAMQEAEYDLLDAYAARELSETDRLRVELALHPAGRFSPEAPGRVIRRPTDLQGNTAAPIREITPSVSASPRWAPLWTVAAALAVASVVTFSIWRAPRRSRAIPPPQATALPASAASAPAPAAPAPSLPVPAPPKPQGTIAEVILPGALRSQSALPLQIAPAVRTVRFLWPVADTDAVAYELQLVGDDGAERCRSRGAVAGRNHALEFSCPAARIPAGTSFLRVLALPAAPDDAPLLEIAVTVAKSR